jgi:hypothetical protein
MATEATNATTTNGRASKGNPTETEGCPVPSVTVP